MTEDLETRVRRQEDVEAIRRLKYRYWRGTANHLWDEIRGCFAEEATSSYGHANGPHRGFWCEGVDAIMTFLEESLPALAAADQVGAPFAHHDEIDVLSDTTARGLWTLGGLLFDRKGQTGSLGGGLYYHDEYLKRDGVWKIRHTGSGLCSVCNDEWLAFYDKGPTPNPIPTPGLTVLEGPGLREKAGRA